MLDEDDFSSESEPLDPTECQWVIATVRHRIAATKTEATEAESGHFGCVFGVAEFVPGGRRNSWTWVPSECEGCEATNLPYHWNNYNYIICPSFWRVISHQLWNRLMTDLDEHAASLIWRYLLEPAQH